MLKTETPHGDHADLDQYAPQVLVDALIDDQAVAAQAVREASVSIARAVEAIVPRLRAGGRLVYVGAGTSGRLGVLDSVELAPTFSWPNERARAVLAGGEAAMFRSAEGAEDDDAQGRADVQAVRLQPNDTALLISASGSTPYVLGALAAARAAGALCVGLANNAHAPLAAQADIAITLDTGSELISGSTRLKAGTAQKIALNTISSALMVRLHKVYGNLMVDLKATNAKLERRAVRLAALAAQVDEATALQALERCEFQVKVAIVSLRCGVDAATARARLDAADGDVHRALVTGAP
jgi:N-acetylmuramic acid 6-phosphate etherase